MTWLLFLFLFFAGDSLDYDVALVRIRSTLINPYIDFNNYVQPACLPTSTGGEIDSCYSTEALCEVSGWAQGMIKLHNYKL